MRAALWFLAIFAAAVGVALFASQSDGTVTLFWPPHRVDISLNLVLLLLLAAFVLLHFALRAVAALLELPTRAKAWRATQRERVMHAELNDAIAHQLAGRFSRARKLAETSAQHAASLGSAVPQSAQVKVLAHLLAAEAAQSLQDPAGRDAQVQAALDVTLPKSAGHIHEGVHLRAARWALDDRDPGAALLRLDALPQGTQRRTLALRLKLRAARQAHRNADALDTARLLAKHGAFSPAAAQSWCVAWPPIPSPTPMTSSSSCVPGTASRPQSVRSPRWPPPQRCAWSMCLPTRPTPAPSKRAPGSGCKPHGTATPAWATAPKAAWCRRWKPPLRPSIRLG
jgi:HemY protein